MTPTFFYSEGIRAIANLSRFGSHCPVPIALLFDSRAVLARRGVVLSTGNASSPRANFGYGADFLSGLPFESVYHWMPMAPAEREELRFRRCAEVLLPSPFPIDQALSYVFARSAPELQTLRSLIGSVDDPRMIDTLAKLRVSANRGLFFRHWTFVQRVTPLDAAIVFQFWPSVKPNRPLLAAVEFADLSNPGVSHRQVFQDFNPWTSLNVTLPSALRSSPIRVSLRLNDALAYEGDFNPPFGISVV